MNKMYKVTSGWVKWRGVHYNSGQQFFAANPNEQEKIVLLKQCEPVKTAIARVRSTPVKLSAPVRKKKQPKAEMDKEQSKGD